MDKSPNKQYNELSPTKSRNRRRKNKSRAVDQINEFKQPTCATSISVQTTIKESSHQDTKLNESNTTAPEQRGIENESETIQTSTNDQLQPEDVQAKNNNKDIQRTNSCLRKQANESRETNELKDQLRCQNIQIQTLLEQVKHQGSKIKELENALVSTSKTCGRFEKLLQQELHSRSELEGENERLNQSVCRLKSQLSVHEKTKSNCDEMIRVLNATLMERETEVSILKLKMTRMQTNSCSVAGANSLFTRVQADKSYALPEKSNSEICQNPVMKKAAQTIPAQTDRDALVWACVPEELTPSRRPFVLQNNVQHSRELSSLDDGLGSFSRNRRYKTVPRCMKNPYVQSTSNDKHVQGHNSEQQSHCQVTNLDDSISNQRSKDTIDRNINPPSRVQDLDEVFEPTLNQDIHRCVITSPKTSISNETKENHYSSISQSDDIEVNALTTSYNDPKSSFIEPVQPLTTPVKLSGFKKMLSKFRRSDSSTSKNEDDLLSGSPVASPFRRGHNRSTVIGSSGNKSHWNNSVSQTMQFHSEKPFAEWDADMLVKWLTSIGLSMYANQCKRWVRCGAHIMNATPAEVDRGLGITNHLHRKKLRLAISELNDDCDKITKAASQLDYMWVARWLDDIGLPQHKDAFIEARIDGRVLNYLTTEDLLGMGIKSLLHHSSIRCGIRVLRSVEFDIQALKRRATSEDEETVKNGSMKHAEDLHLWTCNRVMDWLRMIDLAELAPNLRGSGIHGGLIAFEDGFNIDTLCTMLSITPNRTLLRRHLTKSFEDLISPALDNAKKLYSQTSGNPALNPMAEIKSQRRTQIWFGKLKGSKVAQDVSDDYLCPMYPVEPIIKSQSRRNDILKGREDNPHRLEEIPESVNP